MQGNSGKADVNPRLAGGAWGDVLRPSFFRGGYFQFGAPQVAKLSVPTSYKFNVVYSLKKKFQNNGPETF